MIYFDYSATTPVDKQVLDVFDKVCMEYVGNPNSIHSLGVKSKELIDDAASIIVNYFKISKQEIIYTSGATEANNLAIKGVLDAYPKRNRRIITTKLEHASIINTINRLNNVEVVYVLLNEDGTVDIDNLKELLKIDTLLVSIAMVDSELGIRQPVEEIGELLKNYPKTIFHSDITQALGKINFSLKDVDLASFSAHKIYGLKGIGGLIKKDKINLSPIIDGGKSTTSYRSGTPAVALIASLAKAIKLIKIDNDYVKDLNRIIVDKLSDYKMVKINSTLKSIPNILNFSILGVKPETFVHAMEQHDIYISSKTACSSGDKMSQSVYAVTNDEKRSSSSLRISLSYRNTKDEVNDFLEAFEKEYNNLIKLSIK